MVPPTMLSTFLRAALFCLPHRQAKNRGGRIPSKQATSLTSLLGRCPDPKTDKQTLKTLSVPSFPSDDERRHAAMDGHAMRVQKQRDIIG
jgi:hypothetical protein